MMADGLEFRFAPGEIPIECVGVSLSDYNRVVHVLLRSDDYVHHFALSREEATKLVDLLKAGLKLEWTS